MSAGNGPQSPNVVSTLTTDSTRLSKMFAALPLVSAAFLALSSVQAVVVEQLSLYKGDAPAFNACDPEARHLTTEFFTIITGEDGDNWIDPEEGTTGFEVGLATDNKACLFMTKEHRGCEYETQDLDGCKPADLSPSA